MAANGEKQMAIDTSVAYPGPFVWDGTVRGSDGTRTAVHRRAATGRLARAR